MSRYLAYIRVSTSKQGQHGSSLQEQRDAITAFARRYDLPIAEWYEDRETAAKKGRTQFVRMMSALERGKATGVILHKIDRGARNLWDWARLQDLIDAGVEVRFAHDDLDLRSRGGRLAADIQAVVAADYVRNLRDEVRKGMWGRLKQGFYPWKAPIGYLDQGKARPKAIDPINGPLVKLAFDLYASRRYSFYSLSEELHRHGLHGRAGAPLSLQSIACILRNPFYVGIIRIKKSGSTFQGVHQPLIDARTFELVQQIADGRINTKVQRFEFTFRRLLNCGQCGHLLTGEIQKRVTYYRCHTRSCRKTSIREDKVAGRLKEAIATIGFCGEQLEEVRPYLEQDESSAEVERQAALPGLKLHISAIEDRQRRLTDAYLDRVIDREAYEGRKGALLMELAAARDDLKRAEGDQTDSTLARIEEFFELLKTFELGPDLGTKQKFRDSVENLTSNRMLIGKKLEIELKSPFRELAQELSLKCGGPHRGSLRTFRAGSNRKTAKRDRTVSAQRFEILSNHLEQWEASQFAARRNAHPERKRNPSWFKPQPHRSDDQHPMTT